MCDLLYAESSKPAESNLHKTKVLYHSDQQYQSFKQLHGAFTFKLLQS